RRETADDVGAPQRPPAVEWVDNPLACPSEQVLTGAEAAAGDVLGRVERGVTHPHRSALAGAGPEDPAGERGYPGGAAGQLGAHPLWCEPPLVVEEQAGVELSEQGDLRGLARAFGPQVRCPHPPDPR